MDYWGTKLRALVILDAESKADLLLGYEKKYNAKTQLYLGLGLNPSRMSTLTVDVNTSLAVYPKHRSLTNAALGSCKTVGDFITKYCGAAGVTVLKGEPT